MSSYDWLSTHRLRDAARRLAMMGLRGLSLPSREEGQTLVEYAMILVMVAVVVVAVVGTLGHTIKSVFSNVASSI